MKSVILLGFSILYHALVVVVASIIGPTLRSTKYCMNTAHLKDLELTTKLSQLWKEVQGNMMKDNVEVILLLQGDLS